MMGQFVAVLAACGAVLLMAFAALGIGGVVSRWWPSLPSLEGWEGMAVRFVTGAGVLGLALFLVGQIYFSASLIYGVLIPCAGLNALSYGKPPRFHCSWPLVLCGAVVIVCAVSGLDRPVGDLGADEIAYHYLGPVTWLRDHRIRPVPYESLTAFPATIETLFAAIIGISNDRAPGLLCSLFLASVLVQIHGMARTLGADQRFAGWGAVFFAFMPAVTGTVERGFVDVPFAAFALGAARFALAIENAPSAVVSGLFAGFAAGTKYTGLIVIAVTLLMLCGRKTPLRSLTQFIGVAVAVGGPWYLRNWFTFGTPIYPPPPALYRAGTFETMPLAAAERLQGYMLERGQGLGHTIGDFLLLPFNLTYRTAFFHGAGGIGIGVLALGPVAMIALWQRKEARRWFVWAFLLTTGWFLTDQELRFLDPPLAVGAALAACGWMVCARASTSVRILAAVVVSASVAYGGWVTVQSRWDRLHAVCSPAYAAKRWSENVPFVKAVEWVNHQPDVHGILVQNPRFPTYYLRPQPVLVEGRWGERVIGPGGYSHILGFKAEAFSAPNGGVAVYEDDQVIVYQVGKGE